MAADNFHRANETPLASPWVQDSVVGGSGINLTGNVAYPSSFGCCYYSTSTQAFSEVVLDATSDGGASPAINLDGSGNGYGTSGAYFGTLIAIFRIDAGAQTFIANTTGNYGAGNTVSLSRSGAVLTLKINGVSALTVSDSTYTAGHPGMYAGASTNVFASWDDGIPVIPTVGSLGDFDSELNVLAWF